jgi:pSer/pThr/pTyr-binding forkhead associated (FHA) protein
VFWTEESAVSFVVVLNGSERGQELQLARQESRVGQAEGSDLRLSDSWISWEHARLVYEDGGYWIEDCGSTNGTFVNCSRVDRQQLEHHDVLFLGRTHLLFVEAEE